MSAFAQDIKSRLEGTRVVSYTYLILTSTFPTGYAQAASTEAKTQLTDLKYWLLDEAHEAVSPWRSIVDDYIHKIADTWEDKQVIYAKAAALQTSVQAMTSFVLSSGSVLQSLLMNGDITSCQFLGELDTAYQTIMVELSLSDQGTSMSDDGHKHQSTISTIVAINRVEPKSLQLAAKYGVSNEELQELHTFFDDLAAYIEKVVVIAGMWSST